MDKQKYLEIYWKYYLMLESDLKKIEPYISFDKKNYKCFSNEFIKLYQTICSEFDVICKQYCIYLKKDISEKQMNIAFYKKCITEKHNEIVNEEILFCPNNELILPFSNWKKDQLNWWKQYNLVKHQRTDSYNEKYNYENANLENVILSLGGLYIIEKYFFNDLMYDKSAAKPIPHSRVMQKSKLFGYLRCENSYLDC